jgi:hypothetical protein
VNLPVEVIEAARDGRCLLFVGSRFTAEAREQAGLDAHDGRSLARALGWKPPTRFPGRNPSPVTPSVQSAAADCRAELGEAGLTAALMGLVGTDGVAPTSAHTFVAEHFNMVFTTTLDTLIETAAAESGRPFTVVGRGEPIPEASAERPVLVRTRGSFGAGLCITAEEHARSQWDEDTRRQVRALIRGSVVLFVGYRPDEEEFEVIFEELRHAYRAELPRCHLAVAQGRIDDYQWQRWVWRGLLLFTADPIECMDALDQELSQC